MIHDASSWLSPSSSSSLSVIIITTMIIFTCLLVGSVSENRTPSAPRAGLGGWSDQRGWTFKNNSWDYHELSQCFNHSDAFALKDMKTNYKIIIYLERHEDGELAREVFAHGLLLSDMIISIYNIMKTSPIKWHQIMIISLRMERQDISAKGKVPKASCLRWCPLVWWWWCWCW